MTKPSSLSTCAMVTFTLVEGMSTAGDSMRFALRMRVNMSAIESVIILASLLDRLRLALARRPASAIRKRNNGLPACLLHTRDQTLVRHVAEADPANAELAI